jgi:hypothetical protein
MTRGSSDPFNETTETARYRGRHRAWLWLLVLLLLGTLGLVGALITTQPGTFGLARIIDQDATATAFGQSAAQTAAAFAAQSSALAITRTALDGRDGALAGTAAALDNRARLLDSTATRGALDLVSTATAAAAANAAQATQAAVDFAATQAALAATATQAGRDFQATQTALSGMRPTPLATPGAAANLLTLDAGFVSGAETHRWDVLPPSSAFARTGDGTLVALLPDATLLTQWGDYGAAYAIQAEVIAAPGVAEQTFDLLFGVTDGGFAARLTVRGGLLTTAQLYRFASPPAEGLRGEGDVYARVEGLALPAERLNVRLRLNGGMAELAVDGANIASAMLPVSQVVGAVGVQLPQSAQLAGLRVTRE